MQNHMENKVYAGFFVRLIAFAIDSLLAALVMFTVKSPFAMAVASGVKFLDANFIFHYSFLDVLDYVAVVAYFVLLTYFTHTTPGKMAMKLEVITIDKEWTLLNVIYRETIGRFFSSLLCAGYFAVLVSQKKQGFHDMLCDTFVVYKGVIPAPAMAPTTESVTMAQAVEEPSAMSMDVMLQTEPAMQQTASELDVEQITPEPMVQQTVLEQGAQQITSEAVKDQPVISHVSNEQKEEGRVEAPVYHTMPEEQNSSVE